MGAARKIRRRLQAIATPAEARQIQAESPRAAAVKKFRELADRLERGQLRGARVEWREGIDFITTVEHDGDQVSLLRHNWQAE